MKLNKLNLAILAASSSILSQPTYAQDSHTELLLITVSASPVNEHEVTTVPSQVDVLSGENKAGSDSASLGSMVETIPGVNNQSTGGHAGRPVIRGLNGNRIKVLSNGQNTDYQAYGVRHIQNLDPYLADRIEVIRGPQGVLFGSDAMGGVINVQQAELPYGEETSGELAGEYNSNNRERMLGAKVGAGTKDFAFNAGVVTRDADNFNVPKSGPNPPKFVGEVPYTNYSNRSANIGIGYQQDWGEIEFRFTQWQSKQNYLGLGPGFVASPTGQELNNNEAQLSAEFFTENDWVIKPSWSKTNNQREAITGSEYEAMDDSQSGYLDIQVKRDDVKLALEHPAIGNFEGEVGFEFMEKEQALRSGSLTPSATESKRALYLFEEANFERWLVQMGLRYDRHSVTVPVNTENQTFINKGIFDERNNSQEFGVGSGSLGVTYQIDNQWNLVTNIGSGFRAPSIFELYSGGVHGGVQAYQIGNPELEAETSVNVDLSLRWKTETTKMLATVYQNKITNYIYLANLPGQCYNSAGGAVACPNGLQGMQAKQTDATISGIEFALTHQFNSQWSSDLGIEVIKGENNATNEDLPLIPANNARVALHYSPNDFASLKKQQVSLDAQLVDSKKASGTYEPFSQFDNLSTGTASTDAYTVWGLAYQAQVKLDKQSLKLYASVDNLFDTRYVDFLNTYKGYSLNQGRNVKLGLRMDF